MKVLIIYENIPESTDIFVVDADDSEISDLNLCHRNYINVSEGDGVEMAMDRVSLRLGSAENITQEDCERCLLALSDAAKWNKCIIDSDKPINIKDSDIDLVFITGFYM